MASHCSEIISWRQADGRFLRAFLHVPEGKRVGHQVEILLRQRSRRGEGGRAGARGGLGGARGTRATVGSAGGEKRSIQASASGQGVQRALARWRGSGPALGPARCRAAPGLAARRGRRRAAPALVLGARADKPAGTGPTARGRHPPAAEAAADRRAADGPPAKGATGAMAGRARWCCPPRRRRRGRHHAARRRGRRGGCCHWWRRCPRNRRRGGQGVGWRL